MVDGQQRQQGKHRDEQKNEPVFRVRQNAAFHKMNDCRAEQSAQKGRRAGQQRLQGQKMTAAASCVEAAI